MPLHGVSGLYPFGGAGRSTLSATYLRNGSGLDRLSRKLEYRTKAGHPSFGDVYMIQRYTQTLHVCYICLYIEVVPERVRLWGGSDSPGSRLTAGPQLIDRKLRSRRLRIDQIACFLKAGRGGAGLRSDTPNGGLQPKGGRDVTHHLSYLSFLGPYSGSRG